MEWMDAQRVEAAQWKRYLLYVDLTVLATFCLSIILLVRHTFMAGRLYAESSFGASTNLMWLVVADTAFLVASLAWVFYRFFRMQSQLLARPY